MRVIEVNMERRRNEGAGQTQHTRENPLTNGIKNARQQLRLAVSREHGGRAGGGLGAGRAATPCCVGVDDVQMRPFDVAGIVVSTIYLVEVEDADTGRRLSLFCKLLEKDKLARLRSLMVMHYLNEDLFFGELLPFLLGPTGGHDDMSQLFPRFHFAHRDDVQCVVAIDNRMPLGYKTVQGDLDLEHSIVALQALGKIHALSYVAKRRRPRSFFNRLFHTMNVVGVQYTVSMFRQAQPAECEKYSQQLEEIVSDVTELYGKVYEGHEPMAVLCHGDYKNENLLFKHDGGGSPVALKMIDFQLLSYSSPVIDVSLLLFLSTIPEIRVTHWDTLLASYHDALLDTVSRYLQCSRESLQEVLGHEAFKREFKNYCQHGFYIANFFKPLRFLKPEHHALQLEAASHQHLTSLTRWKLVDLSSAGRFRLLVYPPVIEPPDLLHVHL
ncbi:hypothetical protein PR048_029089 [Dryococelus australis]|uniref:CHK kinase-like domain-containing protein n=1 Tax=Dryococelus australis TaxID=614101 RepID=A0ABQ9GCR9_9NEOP|nr:hypothetical protein PR048_029089 [Dryococelus australis]